MISEVIALRMNEEVAGQLHSGLISITDEHQDRLHRMETHIEGLEAENSQLKDSLVVLSRGLADVRMQSVMCHAMLMHYVETHWEPIGHLFGQIAALSSCGTVPPRGHCLSGLGACLLFDGHQRCSKRRVVWGEGKWWSVGRSEVGRLVIVGEDWLPKLVNKVGECVGE